MIDIRIQSAAFDIGQESQLAQAADYRTGALVCFTGLVRDFDQGADSALYLEHFPGMTEKSLHQIANEACTRFSLLSVKIIHRVGLLTLGEPIVFVATESAHRDAAFQACAFIMDYLKTRAPFWKKEQHAQGGHWVEGKQSDQDALLRWHHQP